MSCVFLTGANRGIGLELVRQYAADGWRVIATCRNPDGAGDLARIVEESNGRVERHQLEVTDTSSVAAIAEAFASESIDVLINNAGMGSITNASSDGETCYRISKAAVNMLTKLMAGYVADRGITVAAIGPGWVRTDMGGPNATSGVEESVSRVRKVIEGLAPTDSGGHFDNQANPSRGDLSHSIHD